MFILIRDSRIALQAAQALQRSRCSLGTCSASFGHRKIQHRYTSCQQCYHFCHSTISENAHYRISANFMRSLSSSSKMPLNELVKGEKWTAVYRFPDIRVGVLLARAKLVQTVAAVSILPFIYQQYLSGEVTLNYFCGASAIGAFAVAMMFFATRYFNRLIGVISMTESNKYVRIGYLSFWGFRRNRIAETEDVIPLSETDSNLNDVLVKFSQFSNPKYLYLSTVKAEIVDEERAEMLFGDLAVFRKEAKPQNKAPNASVLKEHRIPEDSSSKSKEEAPKK